MKALNKLLQMIKQGSVSDASSDSSSYPQGQATYNGKATNFIRLAQYGFDSNPEEGSFLLLLSSQGQEAVKFGIPSAMTKRFKGLKEGEVAVYSPKSKSYLHIKEDGSIDILANLDLNLNIIGNVIETIGGNVTQNITGNLIQTITGNLASTIGGTLDFTVTGNTTFTTPLFKVVGNAEISNNLLVGNTTTTNSLIIGGVPSPGVSTVTGDLNVVGGDIVVTAGSGNLGDITADGTITGITNVVAGTKQMKTHVHGGVTSGGSNTGGPI